MNSLNFKNQIEAAYKELNLIPINGQEFAIDRILTEFFINKKKNVILSAGTGVGKSIIGAVIANVFKNREEAEFTEVLLPSMLVVHSNSLVKQYGNTFKDFGSDEFHQIIGAGNYKCEFAEAMSLEKDKKYTAEDCIKSKADKLDQAKYCDNCEYNIARSHINKTDTLITNYSYHFITSMMGSFVKKRELIIFDEGHTINDVFCDHATIEISAEILNRYVDECTKLFPAELKREIAEMKSIRSSLLREELSEANYVNPLKKMQKVFADIGTSFTTKAEKSNIENYLKYKKLGKKYSSHATRIADLFAYQYDHSVEYKSDKMVLTIKPIFVGKMSSNIMSDYNLFMSATISPEYMKTTMNLDSNSTAYVGLDPVYDIDAKQVIFCGNKKLNYSSLKDPATIEYLQDVVCEIVKSANEDNYKGLMFTPSFTLGELLSKKIPKETKVFLHKSGIKADVIVNEFKAYNGKAILISPSIYEGLDFPGDESRYQILVKCPYASLGDKRIEHIAHNYPDIYKILALKKMIQGLGRSVRNKDDYAISFILDQNAEQLFKSPLNVWRNQFKIL